MTSAPLQVTVDVDDVARELIAVVTEQGETIAKLREDVEQLRRVLQVLVSAQRHARAK